MLNDTKKIVVTRTPKGEISLTMGDRTADTVEARQGDLIAWVPAEPTARVLLFFPAADRPVSSTTYFGAEGCPVVLKVHGTANKHYRYTVALLQDVDYSGPKGGERSANEKEIPPKFSVSAAFLDPVVIIR